MTKSDSQVNIVTEYIEECIEQGMTDKGLIYDKVENETGIARTTIRRICSNLKKSYDERIKVLEMKIK